MIVEYRANKVSETNTWQQYEGLTVENMVAKGRFDSRIHGNRMKVFPVEYIDVVPITEEKLT